MIPFSLKRFVSILVTIALLSAQFATGILFAAAQRQPEKTAPASLAGLPPFPEDALREATDWAAIDWDAPVTLPKDDEAYAAEVSKLASWGKYDEARKLVRKVRHMGDDEVLEYYHVPAAVRALVKEYREGREAGEKDAPEKELLKLRLMQAGFGSKTEDQQAKKSREDDRLMKIIDAKTAKKLSPKDLKVIRAPKNIPARLKSIKLLPRAAHPLENVTIPALSEILSGKKTRVLPKKRSASVFDSFFDLFRIPTAHAQAVTPLIEYSDGIEKRTMDFILYSLSQSQNADGSFGEFNRYEHTASIVLLLSEYGRTESGQFASAVSYLKTATPANNREKAIKARLMVGLGEPYQALLDELKAAQKANGGIGFDDGHGSDVITTLEFALALAAANDSVADRLPAALAYVLSQIGDDGAMYFPGGVSPSYYLINKTAEDLKLFESYMIAGANGQVSVQSKIDALLSFLRTGNGGNDLADKLMTLRSFQLYNTDAERQQTLWDETISQQKSDGSFGSSPYATVAALRVFPEPDLAITDVTSSGLLQNGQPAAFTVTLKNNGYAPVSSGKLYYFFDNVNPNDSIDLAVSNIQVLPNQSAALTVNFPSTESLIGDTEIKFYLEDDDWFVHHATFAAPGDSMPAIPQYYVAMKHDIDGLPALNVRWAQKSDPNRGSYAILFRQQGQTGWFYNTVPNGFNGAFLHGGFEEDATYEVTVGVLNLDATRIRQFNAITTIQMSGNPAKYNGTVKGVAKENTMPLPNVYTYGYSVSATTGSDGTFLYSNVPNGKTAARVSVNSHEEIFSIFPVKPDVITSSVRLFTRLKEDTEPPSISNVEISQEPDFAVKNEREVVIIASAGDNVGVKEGDFYLWDPQESFWRYIGTAQTEHANNYVQFPWYVPQDLVGEGFKIKAVMFDFRGNESSPREWGPFRFVDSTPPEGTVSVAGLTDGKWSLGDTKTISWDIQAANGLQQIQSIRLVFGTSIESLVSNYDVSKTTYDHTMPLNSFFVSDAAYVDMIVCDRNYNCSTLQSAPFRVVDETPPPPPPWGVPQIFDGITSGVNLDRYLVDVFHNPSGSAEIIYREFDGNAYSDQGQYRRIMYRKFTGGAWLEPVALAEYAYRPLQGAQDITFQSIQAVQKGEGDVHIVYQNNVGGPVEALDLAEIYSAHIRPDGTVARQQISNDTTYSNNATIAVSDQGRTYVAWVEGYSFVRQSGAGLLHYRETDGSENWTADTAVTSEQVGWVTLAAEGLETVLMYQYRGQVMFTKKSQGGTFSSPLIIHRPDILRQFLDEYTADTDKLPLLVTPDPLLPEYYLWRPEIVTEQDLTRILDEQNFASRNQILETWTMNDYSYNSISRKLFPLGNHTYDFFSLRYGARLAGYKYDLYHLKFSVGLPNRTRTVVQYSPITDKGPEDDIRSFDAERNQAGEYHVAFMKNWRRGNEGGVRVSHLLYDGQTSYFVSRVSSLLMNVADHLGVQLDEQNGVVRVYFPGYSGGGMPLFVNTADFSEVGRYKIRSTSVGHSHAGETALLDWDVAACASCGTLDNFDVYLGQNPEYLSRVAADVSETQYLAGALAPASTYYWRVVGKRGALQVYSNVFSLQTVAAPTYARGFFEDAEDGDTAGWFVSDDAAPGTITNVADPAWRDGRVISLNGVGWNSMFLLKKPDGSQLGVSGSPVLKFDTTMGSNIVTVRVDTDKGERSLSYVPYEAASGGGQPPYYSFSIDARTNVPDGGWRTFARDIAQDLAAVFPEATLRTVDIVSIRGSGKIDNVELRERDDLFGISGRVLDASGTPLPDTAVSLLPLGRAAKTDALGRYAFTSLPPGDYELGVSKEAYTFASPVSAVPITNASVTKDFTGSFVDEILFEDAEDGDVAGWFVSDDAAPSEVTNVSDDAAHGRVISLNGVGWSSVFMFKNPDGSWLHASGYPVLEFESTIDSNYVTVKFDTTKGDRQITYAPFEVTDHGTGPFNYQFDGRSGVPDGRWRTISIDLARDLASLEPDTRITFVDGISIRGSGKVDNVKLRKTPSVFTLSGVVKNEAGEAMSGAVVQLAELSRSVTTGADGRYAFAGVSSGAYTLHVTKAPYEFSVDSVVVSGAPVIHDMIGRKPAKIILEDAEDGDIAGWFVSDDGAPSTVTNIPDEAGRGGQVISLNGVGWSSVFIFKKPDGSWLNQREYGTLQFDTDMNGAIVNVRLDTTKGDVQFSYIPYEVTDHGTGPFNYQFDGRSLIENGTWRTVTHSLVSDLATVLPEAQLLSVDGIFIRGAGKMDNLTLLP